MTPVELNQSVLTPALALLPPRMDSPYARVLLTAIAMQESALTYRKQVHGPAHGLWQFELGGVSGVMHHPTTSVQAAIIATSRGVDPTSEAVYAAILSDDELAAVIARLLLWTDPEPLPPIDDVDGAWQAYVKNWRPGKPRRDSWQNCYDAAKEIL